MKMIMNQKMMKKLNQKMKKSLNQKLKKRMNQKKKKRSGKEETNKTKPRLKKKMKKEKTRKKNVKEGRRRKKHKTDKEVEEVVVVDDDESDEVEEDMLLLQRDSALFSLLHAKRVNSITDRLKKAKTGPSTSKGSPLVSQTQKLLEDPRIQRAPDEVVKIYDDLKDVSNVFYSTWEEQNRKENPEKNVQDHVDDHIDDHINEEINEGQTVDAEAEKERDVTKEVATVLSNIQEELAAEGADNLRCLHGNMGKEQELVPENEELKEYKRLKHLMVTTLLQMLLNKENHMESKLLANVKEWESKKTENSDSCEDMLIEDCYISVGDDGIAIKSGWDQYGTAYGFVYEMLEFGKLMFNTLRLDYEERFLMIHKEQIEKGD
ncbi:glutamic acid-rich protein-like [Chenopodium quinoa]|uniref:glutamic acid-rich protein-like n=1 Tax=Chenopodium quinoa TaxID=63459 RepID=UPI000B7707E3|nr:glutamic acid-rich protein-like [Chenopodium quinoa]